MQLCTGRDAGHSPECTCRRARMQGIVPALERAKTRLPCDRRAGQAEPDRWDVDEHPTELGRYSSMGWSATGVLTTSSSSPEHRPSVTANEASPAIDGVQPCAEPAFRGVAGMKEKEIVRCACGAVQRKRLWESAGSQQSSATMWCTVRATQWSSAPQEAVVIRNGGAWQTWHSRARI